MEECKRSIPDPQTDSQADLQIDSQTNSQTEAAREPYKLHQLDQAAECESPFSHSV
ncbi:hypothetical protein GCM10010969_36980 [Saccharibacillus kuerlensis]|uniref:Uncharacterized protein n=1 Tax=Saccharibacillus kuerlensis TaxID=459527 RepID=A0ABQ2L9S8_9BACL|nr:hypothetical protein GCM10010969_36980 [Saccharibacillus kuerlensis]